MNFGTFTDVVSLASLIVSSLIWLKLKHEEELQDQKIAIIINGEGGSPYKLKTHIRKKNLTRSELQGVLGALPMKQDRYKIAYLSHPDFFNALDLAQTDKDSNELMIKCSPEELKQFDLEKLKEICSM